MTWRKAIDKVLGSSATPLHYKEITERIIAEGLRKNLGATPADTVNAQIFKHEGLSSPYIRVAKGTFVMRIGASSVSIQCRNSQ
jgi:HB1, ASXL, restriction endonuclease HTH domain